MLNVGGAGKVFLLTCGKLCGMLLMNMKGEFTIFYVLIFFNRLLMRGRVGNHQGSLTRSKPGICVFLTLFFYLSYLFLFDMSRTKLSL